MDIKRRDEIIFGSYDPEQYIGGGIRFIEHLNYSQLKTLIDEGYADPEDRYNESPSIAEFIEFVEKQGVENFVFEGVAYDRAELSVCIWSIIATKPFKTFEEGLAFSSFAGGADDFDEVTGYASWH